ncbi:MAG: DJ-1/PfpI family protein [Nitrospirota bacterium]
MIIAQENFRDEKLLQPKQIREKNGVKVKVASTTLSRIKGMLGAKIKPDILVKDIDVKDFDAIVFIGGIGAGQYWDDPIAHKLARKAFNSNKVVAAICIALVTLAHSGILKGKRATVWSSEIEKMRKKGAIITGKNVERDGNTITASGPFAAGEFGEEILKALKLFGQGKEVKSP